MGAFIGSWTVYSAGGGRASSISRALLVFVVVVIRPAEPWDASERCLCGRELEGGAHHSGQIRYKYRGCHINCATMKAWG